MAMTGKEYGSKPAFPSSRIEEEVRAKVAYNEGVTRRDVFAAFALQGILANPHHAQDREAAGDFHTAALWHADRLCDALAKDGAP